jgi:long-chain acyl-CoA synthetase
VSDPDAPVNVADLLSAAATARPDHTAVVDRGVRLTYRQLDEQVDGVAAGLAELGLVAGNRAALVMDDGAPLVATYLAMSRAGIVAAPLDPAWSADQISRALVDSGARVCVADGGAVDAVREAVGRSESGVRLVVAGVDPNDGEVSYARLADAASRVVSPRDGEGLAVLMYTSDPSGASDNASDKLRAAMLSHRALVANVEQVASVDPPPLGADDVVLGALPLHRLYGLNGVVGQVIRQQATLVIAGQSAPEAALRLVVRESATVVAIAPTVLAGWVQVDDLADSLTSVRALVTGAAPLAEATVRAFEERTGSAVGRAYGLTEAAPVVATTLGTPHRKPGSAGRALPGVQLRVVDELGQETEPGDPGEVLVRGGNLFSGYWPDSDRAPGPEGWLSTGDVGFLDADGDLFLVASLKEVVSVSGFTVYPSEVEDVISEVVGVRECAVIGAADDAGGQSVVAYVVVDGSRPPADVAADVRAHCAKQLARFKAPATVKLVDELPHSSAGGVAKDRLRAGAARRSTGPT